LATVQLPRKLEPLWQPHRYKVAYGGRGGAKSWGFARTLLLQGWEQPLRVLCARETQRSIKDSVHRLLADQIVELGLTDHYEIQKAEIRGVNGTLFVFAGLSTLTVDSIKSFEGADRCWVEEGQTVTKRSWAILIPTIRKAGSEIWVSFNPDLDTDDTYVRFIENTPPDTVKIPIGWRDNPWLSQELINEMNHLKATDELEYRNVWEGECRAAAQGAVYTPEMQGLAVSNRVKDLPLDPMAKVHTFWDTGFNDRTAIIMAQRNATQIAIIDYYEDNHRNMADYAAELQKRKYNWGSHWLPWDASGERYKLTDPATSPEGMLRKLMPGLVQIVPKADVELGIKRARVTFPRCYFDKVKTMRLRECLKRYRRVIPATTNEPSGPAHDEFSHGADAFRYLAMSIDHVPNDTGWAPLKYPKRAYA
jgi:phage terminase large subunit